MPAESDRKPPVDGTCVHGDGAVRGVGQDNCPFDGVAGDDTVRGEGQMDLDRVHRRGLRRGGCAPTKGQRRSGDDCPTKLHLVIVVGPRVRVHEPAGL